MKIKIIRGFNFKKFNEKYGKLSGWKRKTTSKRQN